METSVIATLGLTLCLLIFCVTQYKTKKLELEAKKRNNDINELNEELEFYKKNADLSQKIIKDALGINKLQQDVVKIHLMLSTLYEEYYNKEKFNKEQK